MGGRVRLVVENYGDSELAKRFGVTRYPAIFVDDVLFATPKDFGFYGAGEGSGAGRYAPWKNAESHARFRADLERMLERALAGEAKAMPGELAASPDASALTPATLPGIALTGLDGRPIARESLLGRPLLVEFWATWCPPCRGTLTWMGDLRKRHGGRIETLALAVESDEADVRAYAAKLDQPLRWAMATPELARAFGDLTAVPTLYLFDAEGRLREIFYGAPPDLHDRAERALAELLE